MLLNRVLSHYGLSLSDWAGSVYTLRDAKGRSAVVTDIGSLWSEAEKLAGRPLDPLEPASSTRSPHDLATLVARKDGSKTPVTLVTGFLGSGKTTLISRLLAHPDLGETAVIVNELGEVGIDHHLLRRVDERTVLLDSGCVCCTLRGDLADELRDLDSRRARGEIPAFRRVVVETTGLADPAPIAYTLAAEPVVRHHFELGGIVATVDAVNGLVEPESVKQAAVADVLVVTKGDVADPSGVESELRRLNPAAEIVEASFGEIDPALLLDRPARDLRELRIDGNGHVGDIRPVLPAPRRAARLDRLRDLADDAAPGARRRPAARERPAERGRATDRCS